MKPTLDRGKAEVAAEPGASAALATPEPPRGTIAEWTITILLLLFGTTTLVQAFVIPTGSMEDTLLIGDHLLVDKLAYAPGGTISKYILPYENPRDGDIIVFRYPEDISQTFVKRVVGVPGDHIKIIDQQVYRNGQKLVEPYVVHKSPYPDSFRDNFPNSEPNFTLHDRGRDMLASNVVTGKSWCRPVRSSPWAITAITRSTAVIGALCRARTSSASRSLFTGRTMPAPRVWPVRR